MLYEVITVLCQLIVDGLFFELSKTRMRRITSYNVCYTKLLRVASACNVSQTAPYRHFKSKDDLITAIVMEAMQAFDEKLSESFQKYPADPEMLLKEMGIAYVHFFYENPEYLRLLFSSRLFEKIKNNNICGDGNKSTAKA